MTWQTTHDTNAAAPGRLWRPGPGDWPWTSGEGKCADWRGIWKEVLGFRLVASIDGGEEFKNNS